MIQKVDYKFSLVAMSEKVSEIGSGSGDERVEMLMKYLD